MWFKGNSLLKYISVGSKRDVYFYYRYVCMYDGLPKISECARGARRYILNILFSPFHSRHLNCKNFKIGSPRTFLCLLVDLFGSSLQICAVRARRTSKVRKFKINFKEQRQTPKVISLNFSYAIPTLTSWYIYICMYSLSTEDK